MRGAGRGHNESRATSVVGATGHGHVPADGADFAFRLLPLAPMTADDYATLMDFLATRFARMDAAFAALDSRMARMEARQDAMEARLDALEERLTRAEVLREAMRDDIRRVAEGLMAVNERLDRFQVEMRTRLDEHDRRFDRIDARLDEHDRRFDRIDARLDEHDRRFDRIDTRLDGHDRRFDSLDRGLGGVQVQFDRFAVDFGTVQLDHSARIEALERHRRRRGPGG